MADSSEYGTGSEFSVVSDGDGSSSATDPVSRSVCPAVYPNERQRIGSSVLEVVGIPVDEQDGSRADEPRDNGNGRCASG